MARINYLEFPLPTDLWEAFSDREAFPHLAGTVVNNALRLPVAPENYTPILDPPADEIRDGRVSAQVLVTAKRLGFEVESANGWDEIVLILQELTRRARQTPGAFAPVVCRDYLALEDAEAISQGYTLRYGVLSVTRASGTVRRSDSLTSQRLNLGFTLTFLETERRG